MTSSLWGPSEFEEYVSDCFKDEGMVSGGYSIATFGCQMVLEVVGYTCDQSVAEI